MVTFVLHTVYWIPSKMTLILSVMGVHNTTCKLFQIHFFSFINKMTTSYTHLFELNTLVMGISVCHSTEINFQYMLNKFICLFHLPSSHTLLLTSDVVARRSSSKPTPTTSQPLLKERAHWQTCSRQHTCSGTDLHPPRLPDARTRPHPSHEIFTLWPDLIVCKWDMILFISINFTKYFVVKDHALIHIKNILGSYETLCRESSTAVFDASVHDSYLSFNIKED